MRIVSSLTAAAFAAFGLPSPGLGAPAVHEVAAAGGPAPMTWRWDPAAVDAARGDRVVWRNQTSSAHVVVIYEGPMAGKTLQLPRDGVRRLRLKKPGTYLYRCGIELHSELVGGRCVGQCGEITVE
ncbi:MAG TPA: hypothetical protein VM784_00790 [Actinomycetota bacterium]|jgi:plastocyanin|nr:hypothetical protein [Actinomycetota bacterium]